ncbi:MAG TPA: FGGY-family carbohydrate kinase [Anaerolineales bacterium]|nr:FGGY-family carbohydrate kinase [Anaerolineales bacterium]
MAKYVLSIDLGTGGPKVGLVDQQGRVVCSTSAPVQLFFLPDGGAEHDPAEWWSTITTCAKKVIRESAVPSTAIIAVAVTSMWSVTLPVDENGEPLMNALSWMDARGGPYNRDLVKGFPNIQGYKLSTLLRYLDKVGFPPTLKGVDSLGHMLFIKNACPEIYRRTYKFLEPTDYINMRLTGRCVATQNTVMPMVMVDNRRLNMQEYEPWLLKMSGIDREKLPDLLPIDGIVGTVTATVANELGLSPKTVVICGVNDNSSSAIGVGSIADSEPAAVMGTSGYLASHVSFKKTDLNSSIATMPSGIPGRYLFIGELANNTKVLDSYLKNLIYAQDVFETGNIPDELYERASQLAADVPPGSEGVIFLPWFNGSFAPGEDQYMRGGFLNLSYETSRAQLTRAVFEGLAMNWRWLRGPSEKLIGRPFHCWRLTGGGALSDVWSQIMADVVGLPMHRQADPRNNNVIGIALLAFQRLGLVRLEDIPKMIRFDRVFEPNPKTRPVYDRMFAQFMAARKKIRPVFHALNR